MNDQRNGIEKCAEEIKCAIYDFDGPLTKYLNGQLDMDSEFQRCAMAQSHTSELK